LEADGSERYYNGKVVEKQLHVTEKGTAIAKASNKTAFTW